MTRKFVVEQAVTVEFRFATHVECEGYKDLGDEARKVNLGDALWEEHREITRRLGSIKEVTNEEAEAPVQTGSPEDVDLPGRLHTDFQGPT